MRKERKGKKRKEKKRKDLKSWWPSTFTPYSAPFLCIYARGTKQIEIAISGEGRSMRLADNLRRYDKADDRGT